MTMYTYKRQSPKLIKEPSMTTGYEEAALAIRNGKAKGHAHWALISTESQRDGYALKPGPWEGPGEYQRVTFDDGGSRYILIPDGKKSLPVTKRH